jgi:hypothetical protein
MARSHSCVVGRRSRFTAGNEGFDTRDLKEAKALLQELAG